MTRSHVLRPLPPRPPIALAGPSAMPQPPGPGPLSIPQRIANQEQRLTVDQQTSPMPPFRIAQGRENLQSIQAEYDRFTQINGGVLAPGQFGELDRRLDNEPRFITVNER